MHFHAIHGCIRKANFCPTIVQDFFFLGEKNNSSDLRLTALNFGAHLGIT